MKINNSIIIMYSYRLKYINPDLMHLFKSFIEKSIIYNLFINTEKLTSVLLD